MCYIMYATSIVKEKKIYIHRGKSLHNLLLKNVRYLFFACRGVYGVLIVMLMISSVVCFPPQNWTRSEKKTRPHSGGKPWIKLDDTSTSETRT